ncbi:polyhomeotic-like protein 3 isoform X2 [Electrophorus electricus]|uniref:polyhomeotic-like protein 3 isoform X2 n=1 Tax=Electrophorus electricus TaxID=8005 RepID=UPI0015D0A14D|nr:polyhomeotic-like protein 3 isoform X2 [Electrophorus electricus]
MDKESQAKPEPAKSASPTVTTTTTTATASTVSPSQQTNGTPKSTAALTTVTTFHNQPPTTDRKVIQVIQQTSRQPRGSAAQLLQQMYAAQQQQHGVLQPAAPQQQCSRSASAQQVNLFGDRLAPSFSTAVSSSQQTQKVVSAPSVPGSPPMVRASPSPSPTSTSRKISPQALLLGKSPCSQAQMLLRAQMLQSLTLRPPPPGTLTIPPNLPLKSATPGQRPALSRPKASNFSLRPSPPPSATGKETTMGAEGTTLQAPSASPKAPPVRHLTVPPPSLYAPAQSHALAKQKLASSGAGGGSLKRSHSQISIPQHPFSQRQAHPSSPPAAPKKPLPELKRCPASQPAQSGPTQVSVPITVPSPSRSHLTPPTMSLPLSSSSPGGSFLATKQLLRIALSSASAQCTNGQSKATTVSPPHEVIQSKPLASTVLAKPECPVQSPQTSTSCPQLAQLSPSRQATAPRLASPQRASPPSPVLPLMSTSSSTSSAPPPRSPLASRSPAHAGVTSTEPRASAERRKQEDSVIETPQDLKLPASHVKGAEQNQTVQNTATDPQCGEAVDKPTVCKRVAVCAEESTSQCHAKLPLKPEALPISVRASPADREDICEDLSAHSDNHSAISSLSSDLSPLQSTAIRPSEASPTAYASPPKFTGTPDGQPAQQPPSSDVSPAGTQHCPDTAGPLILTHLVEGFIIQEGLEPFPVSRSSLMVSPHCGSGLNGTGGTDLFPTSSEPPDDSTDSDDETTITNNGAGVGHRLVLQCQFCKRKGTAQTFARSKRFCSKSCAKRFSYTKRFRSLRRCVSEGGHRSECNGGEEELQEENFQQAKHGATEQWRILQRPLQEGEDEMSAPMKTRLRRHTEQGTREMRARETPSETASAPTSPLDPVSPADLSAHPRPAQWTVDQVWSFISNLPGCQDIAESFRAQEIDGQALLLLTEDHLMSAMNVKLGPALKICARINSLKEGGR